MVPTSLQKGPFYAYFCTMVSKGCLAYSRHYVLVFSVALVTPSPPRGVGLDIWDGIPMAICKRICFEASNPLRVAKPRLKATKALLPCIKCLCRLCAPRPLCAS